jgi:endonuclease/exonuclease/phosphatase family metal-dependent hydrolase
VDEIVVASFNVHWGLGLRRDGYPDFDVPAACKGLDADVLVLQESWAPDGATAQHDAVAEALGMDVVAAVPMARMRWRAGDRPELLARGGDPADGSDGAWCLAVLSGLPASPVAVEPIWQLPLDPVARAVVRAEVRTGSGTLSLAATHWSHLEMGSPLQTRALRRALPDPGRPAVLAGDMNMWSWTLAAMVPRTWRRAVPGRTWPSPRPHSQIDHLLVTPAVEVVTGEVLDLVASDHRPVRATCVSRLARPGSGPVTHDRRRTRGRPP